MQALVAGRADERARLARNRCPPTGQVREVALGLVADLLAEPESHSKVLDSPEFLAELLAVLEV